MMIAITGGIGSGKSMVRRIIESLGGYTIDADSVNRELMTKAPYIAKIKEFFPEAVINERIDKTKLSEIIFNDDKSLIKLNSIAHPLITGIIMYEASLIEGRHIFVEVPLLAESGMSHIFDRIWYVESDMDIRVRRVMDRSSISMEMLDKIIKAQGNSASKDLATDIIINNSSEECLWEKVQRLYLQLS